MSITKETRVTLRVVVKRRDGFEDHLTRVMDPGSDEITVSVVGYGDYTLPTAAWPALIAGLQELLGAA